MSQLEALTLDGLALNDGITFSLEALSLPVPTKLAEWIKGADSNGALLSRPPLHENRVIEATVRVERQATMDLALAKIALLEDKLQECEQQENGLALTWVPADATLTAITFRCLLGEVTGMPIAVQGDSGWFVKAPQLTIRMTCFPFGEGTEALLATTSTSTAPIVTVELSGVAGDVPAKGRLVVSDAATQSRRWVAWGLESRYLPTSSPPSLIVDSTGMVTSGFAGATATRTGAYSGGTNNTISMAVRPQVQAVCGLGNLAHVGSFRVYLRCNSTISDLYIRLAYQALDGPWRNLPFKEAAVTGTLWSQIDLGLITIPETVVGTQRWTGRIEAYSASAGTVYVDAVWLMPAEQFGRARATYSYQPGVQVAYDDFTGITAGTVLNARVAPLGGTWATSGATTDFTAADSPLATDETMARGTASDASPRYAVLGSTNYTNTEVGVNWRAGTAYGFDTAVYKGVIARWVDSSNYLVARVLTNTAFSVSAIVAGAIVSTAEVTGLALTANTWYRLRVIAFTTGTAFADLLDASGAILRSLTIQHSSLATGGALATGKPGIFDQHNSVVPRSRLYDAFYASTPAVEPIALYSGQSIEFRHDSEWREDSTGTYAGPPPEYVGSRFTIPQAGGPGREARVAVIARRQDVTLQADESIADSTTVQVYATSRYLAVPR